VIEKQKESSKAAHLDGTPPCREVEIEGAEIEDRGMNELEN